MVDMNRELLRAGYRLHLVFDDMIQEVRKDADNWMKKVSKKIIFS